jgi:mannose-6-phosphate isomerase-like protein (cupin superfamily)
MEENMSSADNQCRHLSLDAALAKLPPPAGELAVSMFTHGSLDVELYAPRDIDTQTPHSRDEVYVVARGNGYFFDGEVRDAIEAGSVLFVPAGQIHRFEDFSPDFAVWVMFYGPEGGEGDRSSAGADSTIPQQ